MLIGASTSNRKNASNGHLLAVFLLVYYWCTRRQKTAAHLTHYPVLVHTALKKHGVLDSLSAFYKRYSAVILRRLAEPT